MPPEHLLRRLFETAQLTVRLYTDSDSDSDDVSFHITLPEHQHTTEPLNSAQEPGPCS